MLLETFFLVAPMDRARKLPVPEFVGFYGEHLCGDGVAKDNVTAEDKVSEEDGARRRQTAW